MMFSISPHSLCDVVRRENQQRLAALHHAALHLLDARRAAREVAEVDEGFQPGLLDAIEQFAAHPRFVVAAVGDEDVEFVFGLHDRHRPLVSKRIIL